MTISAIRKRDQKIRLLAKTNKINFDDASDLYFKKVGKRVNKNSRNYKHRMNYILYIL